MKIPQTLKNFIHSKRRLKPIVNTRVIKLRRDWKIVLTLSFTCFVLLVVWSLYLLDLIKKDDFLKANPNAPILRSAVNEKKLENVTNTFLEKAKDREKLKNTPLPISDPSR
jgi:hypothetical protein